MPRQNRVTPLGELIATPARALVYANRGCLHDAAGNIRQRYPTRRWIACRLEFRGRRRAPLMAPGRFTELFFLDEATALAAGHRPCGECRRADHVVLTEMWGRLHPGRYGVEAIDTELQAERLDSATRRRRLHDRRFGELPDGAFVLDEDGEPWLVRGEALRRWAPGGYTERRPRPPARARARVLTPPSLLELLRVPGREPLVPLLHPSADE